MARLRRKHHQLLVKIYSEIQNYSSSYLFLNTLTAFFHLPDIFYLFEGFALLLLLSTTEFTESMFHMEIVGYLAVVIELELIAA